MNMISKEDFVKALEEVEQVNQYHNDLNKFFRKNKVDGYIYQPECICTVLRLLHLLFENTGDEIIYYFCYELDFGKKWEPGMITENGNDIKLANVEDLYDYLTRDTK